eukprot:TRINITY_DN5387_c0_g1_i1.p1 TRINITY_DN5387_c0_g1~~TRINITY_DN5387_c0_g1_i1.p1  ORF type:complete len:512 (+),score=47.01 TRINITY_DN5387_c0_g1_i1:55-1536(+)
MEFKGELIFQPRNCFYTGYTAKQNTQFTNYCNIYNMRLLCFFGVFTLFLAVSCDTSRLTEKEFSFVGEDISVIDPPHSYAGYFKLNRTYDAQMFYILIESQNDPDNDPLVVWLQGGPGCSSEFGIFYENGPYYLAENGSLARRPISWDLGHTMLYVDQPIFVGFSYSDDPKDRIYNETQVGQDMYEFMQEFLKAHPKYIDVDFFVSGESYGGHYIPAVAYRIFQANQVQEGPININLKGIAIGDGYTDPTIQFGAYADFAYMNGLLTEKERDIVNSYVPECQLQLSECDASRTIMPECAAAQNYCWDNVFNRLEDIVGYVNPYNYKLRHDYNMTGYVGYLNRPDIQKILGVDREFYDCSNSVGYDFEGDEARNVAWMLPPMLKGGIRINLYIGNIDLICNWLGIRRYLDKMEWFMAEEWASVTGNGQEWTLSDGKPAGTVIYVGPLQYTIVYEAGHMVPRDQPEAAYHQMYHFTRDISLLKSSEAGVNLVAEE